MLRLFCALVLSAFAGSVQAATIQWAPELTQVAIGITGLQTGGQTYDVIFWRASFDDLNSPDNFPFLGGGVSAATTAMDDIVAVLNANAAKWVEGQNEINTQDTQLFLPYDFRPQNVGAEVWSVRAVAQGNPVDFVTFDTHIYPRVDPIIHVRMTLIPIPASVWLFGSALGLLGWVRRR